MPTRVLRATALFLSLFVALGAGSMPEEKKDILGDLMGAVGKSAGSSVALAGAKWVIGRIYDGTCRPKMEDVINQAICDGFASFSGRNESQWKEKMEAKLNEISTRLETIDRATTQIQASIDRNHKETYRLFLQAASRHEAARVETRTINLWSEFKDQFDNVDEDLNREAMVRFAKKIISNNLDRKLGDLNTVLTHPIGGGQPLLRYPFYAWSDTRGFNAPPETFNSDGSVDAAYDFAEKAFMDFRMQQQKLFIMYVWAAKVLELDCEMGNTPCVEPPSSSKEIKRNYDRYTREQVERFNEGLEWLLMAYGRPSWGDPWFLPLAANQLFLRANYLNAAILGEGNGVWGRVISMGDAWDGNISLQCGAASGTIKPVFSYLVPVHGRNSLTAADWWTSRASNGVFDEVRFSPNWKVFHYFVPNAPVGPCTVADQLPKKGILPWVQTGTQVVRAQGSDGGEVTFGSFLAMHRAGGAYALASGSKWSAPKAPIRREWGGALIEDHRFEYTIDTNGKSGFPYAALISQGRGEYKVRFSGGGSRVENYNQLYLVDTKNLYFPENRGVTVNMIQSGDCAKACPGSNPYDHAMLDYNIENSAQDKAKGKLDAVVSVFLSPAVGNPDVDDSNWPKFARGSGIVADGSYGPTNGRKQMTASAPFAGAAKLTPDVPYHLSYLIHFEMHTEGSGLDSTHWMYRGKITPYAVYLTK